VISLAQDRGLPVSIYRIDLISGDQENGACQTRDFVWLSIKGLLQVRAVPADLAGLFHMVPVDYISAAILNLSRKAEDAGRTFHFYNESHLGLSEIVAYLSSFGYALAELDWGTWNSLVKSDRDNAMIPLLDAFEVMTSDSEAFYLPIDTTETKLRLADSGIECPTMTKELFGKYVVFFVKAGYFPPVTKGSEAEHSS
jgi:5-hydroxydodecatetraenal polyketide synthase CpkC